MWQWVQKRELEISKGRIHKGAGFNLLRKRAWKYRGNPKDESQYNEQHLFDLQEQLGVWRDTEVLRPGFDFGLK